MATHPLIKRSLIILLHDPLAPLASWTIQTQQHSQIVSNAHLAALSITPHDQISVLIPTQDCLITELKLAIMPSLHLPQAALRTLQPQLLADKATLSCVCSPQQEDGLLTVALIATTTLQAWLALLKTYNIRPKMLAPAIFALPYRNNGPCYTQFNNYYQVRSGLYTGFACPPAQLAVFCAGDPVLSSKPPAQHIAQLDLEQLDLDHALNLMAAISSTTKAYRYPSCPQECINGLILLLVLLLCLSLSALRYWQHHAANTQALTVSLNKNIADELSRFLPPEPKLGLFDPDFYRHCLTIIADYQQPLTLNSLSWDYNRVQLALSKPTKQALRSFINYLSQHQLAVQVQKHDLATSSTTILLTPL